MIRTAITVPVKENGVTRCNVFVASVSPLSVRGKPRNTLRLANGKTRLGFDICSKPDGFLSDPVFDDLFKPVESAATDEQNIGGVHLDELLVRVLAAALRRHIGHRTLQNLQQRLLNALAADIAGDRRIVGPAGDLIDFININDTALRQFEIVVRILQQFQQRSTT